MFLTILFAIIAAAILIPLIGPLIAIFGVLIFYGVLAALCFGIVYAVFTSELSSIVLITIFILIIVFIFNLIYNFFSEFFLKHRDPKNKSFVLESFIPFFLTEKKKYEYFNKIEQIRINRTKKIEDKKIKKQNDYEAQINKEREADKKKKEEFVSQIRDKLSKFEGLESIRVQDISENHEASVKLFKVSYIELFKLTFDLNSDIFHFNFKIKNEIIDIDVKTPLYGTFSINKIIPYVVKILKSN